jgi:hypothetical protein
LTGSRAGIRLPQAVLDSGQRKAQEINSEVLWQQSEGDHHGSGRIAKAKKADSCCATETRNYRARRPSVITGARHARLVIRERMTPRTHGGRAEARQVRAHRSARSAYVVGEQKILLRRKGIA